MSHLPPPNRDSRLAAIAMAACCLLGLLALLHHPARRGGESAAAAELLVSVNAGVHASMLVLALLLSACLAQYTQHRGWSRLWPRTGFLLFATGALAACFAGLINGFVAPDLMQALPGPAAGGDEVVRAAMWAGNQRLMALCGFCLAAAVACWSLDLWREPGRRGLALAGLVLAMAEIVWQLWHGSRFDVPAMQLFWGWLCLACGLFAWVMLRTPAKA